MLKEKRLYIFPTSAFFTCGAKSSQYIVKNLNLFCKTYEFFSGDCLLVERNTLTSCFLTFVTLPFSFLNLIFVEKKAKINCSIFFSRNTQLFASKTDELLSMLLSLSLIFSAVFKFL